MKNQGASGGLVDWLCFPREPLQESRSETTQLHRTEWPGKATPWAEFGPCFIPRFFFGYVRIVMWWFSGIPMGSAAPSFQCQSLQHKITPVHPSQRMSESESSLSAGPLNILMISMMLGHSELWLLLLLSLIPSSSETILKSSSRSSLELVSPRSSIVSPNIIPKMQPR